MKIGFIGAGNMGGAILKGYIKSMKNGSTDIDAPETGDEIYVMRKDPAKLEQMCSELGTLPCSGAEELTGKSDVIILAVKPKDCDQMLSDAAGAWAPDKVLVSMAAGVTMAQLAESLGEHGSTAKIIRIMPNTPAQVGEAMISLSANSQADDDDIAKALKILEPLGKVRIVDEDMIHTVIGVSGSSPAYTYMYIDALAKAAVKNGMPAEDAIVFAAQSVLGAAKMVLETGEDPQILCDNVCSPGGTTIEAVYSLRDNGFEKIVMDAFQAGVDKSIEMSQG